MKEQPSQSLESQLQMARPRRGEVERVPLTPEEKEFLGEIMKKAVAAEKAGDLSEALKYYTDYRDEFLKIKDKKEIEKNLKKQYQEQIDTLTETNLIEPLPSGEMGFYDINGEPRRIPTYEEILERLNAKKELLEKKREQGFTQLLLVPFGMKLSDMVERTKKLILKKHKQGNLKGTNGDDLGLNEEELIWLHKDYQGGNADISGDLVYFPKKYDKEDHGGKTKKEILEETDGWDVMFIEDLPDLPAKGKGKEVGGRKQLEANKTSEQYLEMMQKEDQYAGEQGMTLEAELTYFIYNLQRKNQVIDDFLGAGKANWNLGGYLKSLNNICGLFWDRNRKWLALGKLNPDRHYGKSVRSSVRI